MDINICDKCRHSIAGDPICCDGICGSKFHRDCIKRPTRQLSGNTYTCASCLEVKPCHILKAFLVLNEKLDAINDKTSVLERSLANMKSDFSTLLSDRDTILTRVDHLLDNNRSLDEVLSKFGDLANKNNILTKQLDNTLSDINLTPDLSSIRHDLDLASGSLRDMVERLRVLAALPGIRSTSTLPIPVSSMPSSSRCEPPASLPMCQGITSSLSSTSSALCESPASPPLSLSSPANGGLSKHPSQSKSLAYTRINVLERPCPDSTPPPC